MLVTLDTLYVPISQQLVEGFRGVERFVHADDLLEISHELRDWFKVVIMANIPIMHPGFLLVIVVLTTQK